MLEDLMERSGCNPLIVVDVLLLLVKEAQKPTGMCQCWHKKDRHGEAQDDGEALYGCVDCDCQVFRELDGIDIAKQGLFAVCDYEKELRDAKERRRKLKRGEPIEEEETQESNSLVPKAIIPPKPEGM